jgi:REP element-mobilizing transposase RayT
MNRGDNRRKLFNTAADYNLFIKKLGDYADAYQVEVRAFCLMTNHFHLYVSTPEGNLSRFMQSLLTSFTSVMNHRQGTSGHLFQGRFKSIVVEDDKYGMALCRYIHLNPVRTMECSIKSIDEKRSILRGYKWGSYGILIGLAKCPRWLDRYSNYPWPGPLKKKQKKYAGYVEEGLLKEIDNPMEQVKAQCALGTDGFLDMLRRKVVDFQEKTSGCPQLKSLSSFFDFDRLAEVISSFYAVDKPLLFSRNIKGNEARRALIHFSELYCRGRYPLIAIAERLNLTLGGYASCRRSIRDKLKDDRGIQKEYNILAERIDNVKCKN